MLRIKYRRCVSVSAGRGRSVDNTTYTSTVGRGKRRKTEYEEGESLLFLQLQIVRANTNRFNDKRATHKAVNSDVALNFLLLVQTTGKGTKPCRHSFNHLHVY